MRSAIFCQPPPRNPSSGASGSNPCRQTRCPLGDALGCSLPGVGRRVPGIFCHPSPETKPPWGFTRVFSPSFPPARFCRTSSTTVGHPGTILIQITCWGDRCLPLGELLGPGVPPLPWGTPGRFPGLTDGTARDGAMQAPCRQVSGCLLIHGGPKARRGGEDGQPSPHSRGTTPGLGCHRTGTLRQAGAGTADI